MTDTYERANGDTQRKTVIVERSRELATSMANELERRGFDVAAMLDGPQHVTVEVRAHSPDLLVLQMSEDAALTLENLETLTREHSNLRVIVTAPEAEADLILKAMRAGASEFLVQPVSDKEFRQALDRVSRTFGPRNDRKKGQLFAVYSPKGGLGCTTIAVNLACSLAEAHPEQRVALVDAVMRGGDIPIFLDLQPQYTIGDLAGKVDRLDDQLIEKVMHRHASGVWVLSEPGHTAEADAITGEEIGEVLARLRAAFDFVVLDCEHQLTDRTLAILDAADRILLLTVLSVPATRQLQRTLDVFGRLGYPDRKIDLLVNRHQTSDVLHANDVEKTLGRPVRWRLPNDYQVTTDAITRGKPLIKTARRSKLQQSFEELAGGLNSVGSPPRQRALADRMRTMFIKSKDR